MQYVTHDEFNKIQQCQYLVHASSAVMVALHLFCMSLVIFFGSCAVDGVPFNDERISQIMQRVEWMRIISNSSVYHVQNMFDRSQIRGTTRPG